MASQIRYLAVAVMANMVSASPAGGAAPAASGGATSTAATTAAAAAKALQQKAAALNQDFYNYIFIVLASVIAALTIWRVGMESVKYIRTMTSLNDETQRYFALPSNRFASIKKHLLYAPVFSKRHNREFQLSSAINVGTLPTRFQLLFLSAYFGTNIAFCVVSISWSQPLATVCQQLRNRTGILAVVNMVCHSFNNCSHLSRGIITYIQ
jgi:hypothetical protein